MAINGLIIGEKNQGTRVDVPGARDRLMFVCMCLILYWLSEAPEARFHVIVMRRKADSLQEAWEAPPPHHPAPIFKSLHHCVLMLICVPILSENLTQNEKIPQKMDYNSILEISTL